jgi:hypothetical protein
MLHPTLAQHQWTSSLTRLKLIYVGSILLGVAWIVYQVFCDEVIKRHPSEADYLREQATIGPQNEVERVLGVVQQFVTRPNPGADATFTKSAPRTVSSEIQADKLHWAVRNDPHAGSNIILRAYYKKLEIDRSRELYVCLSLIALGLLLVSIPSAEVFILVLQKIFVPF